MGLKPRKPKLKHLLAEAYQDMHQDILALTGIFQLNALAAQASREAAARTLVLHNLPERRACRLAGFFRDFRLPTVHSGGPNPHQPKSEPLQKMSATHTV